MHPDKPAAAKFDLKGKLLRWQSNSQSYAGVTCLNNDIPALTQQHDQKPAHLLYLNIQ